MDQGELNKLYSVNNVCNVLALFAVIRLKGAFRVRSISLS